jgi:hypothetical protein
LAQKKEGSCRIHVVSTRVERRICCAWNQSVAGWARAPLIALVTREQLPMMMKAQPGSSNGASKTSPKPDL